MWYQNHGPGLCKSHTTVRTAKHAAAAQGGAHGGKRPPTRPANWPPASITHHAPARRTARAPRTALRNAARRASCDMHDILYYDIFLEMLCAALRCACCLAPHSSLSFVFSIGG